ncbi:unnamed protein product [Rotaria sp. Silwood1]|nr:unnamed protein product [Rotaria sp. Silwood1]
MKELTRNAISIDSIQTQIQAGVQEALVDLHEATEEADNKVRNMLSRINTLARCNPLAPPEMTTKTTTTTSGREKNCII